MSRLLLHVFVFLSVVPWAITATAQAATHDCSAVIEDARRLACFDASFPPSAAVKEEIDKASRERALREFGLDGTQLRDLDPGRKGDDEGPARIEAVVRGVEYGQRNERSVTLDNGQVWVLPEATSRGHLETGDRVVVRSAALGSFVLVTPGRALLRARRVK